MNSFESPQPDQPEINQRPMADQLSGGIDDMFATHADYMVPATANEDGLVGRKMTLYGDYDRHYRGVPEAVIEELPLAGGGREVTMIYHAGAWPGGMRLVEKPGEEAVLSMVRVAPDGTIKESMPPGDPHYKSESVFWGDVWQKNFNKMSPLKPIDTLGVKIGRLASRALRGY